VEKQVKPPGQRRRRRLKVLEGLLQEARAELQEVRRLGRDDDFARARVVALRWAVELAEVEIARGCQAAAETRPHDVDAQYAAIQALDRLERSKRIGALYRLIAMIERDKEERRRKRNGQKKARKRARRERHDGSEDAGRAAGAVQEEDSDHP
jgi:hypothetical protein